MSDLANVLGGLGQLLGWYSSLNKDTINTIAITSFSYYGASGQSLGDWDKDGFVLTLVNPTATGYREQIKFNDNRYGSKLFRRSTINGNIGYSAWVEI